MMKGRDAPPPNQERRSVAALENANLYAALRCVVATCACSIERWESTVVRRWAVEGE